jgi:AhpD family alkylhydroperoxidase
VACVTRTCCHSDRPAGISWSSTNEESEDTVSDTRFNLFENELASKFAKRFANTSMVIAQSTLPMSTQELVALRASQINGCGWCADMHTKEAAAAGETAVRLALVATWRESTVFTEAERAALALAEEGTRIADAAPGVSDDTWAQVRKHYDDDQTAALVAGIALINAANRLAVIVHQKGGSYEAGMFAAAMS